MKFSPSYDRYLNHLMGLVTQLSEEQTSQNTIAQAERNTVSEIENRYMRLSEELQKAEQVVRSQYLSVWESCVQEGIRIPRDQRPAATDLSWQEAIQRQERAASRIRDWFTNKAKQATLERQRKLQKEAARRAALAEARAEEARREAEEEARTEKERANALIEALKRKHRR